MGIPKLIINRIAGGLGRFVQNDEGQAALIAGGVSVVGGVQLDTPYLLNSLKAAKGLNITADYDVSNKILVYYHISEFFRLNPTGKLYLMLVAQNTSLTAMCDKANDNLKKLLQFGQGNIRKAGVVLNPNINYTPTLQDGLDADVLAAIPVAQDLADYCYANGFAVNNICIEGRSFNGTVGSAKDLTALVGGPYRDISVCIAQDILIASVDALFAPTAAIGTYLGVATNKRPSECFAQPILRNNLTNAIYGRFLKAGLSNSQTLSSLDQNDVDLLHDKGYVFTRTFNNYAGVYFNQSNVCAPKTDDYDSSEMRDVMNYAVRLVSPVLVPYLNSTDFQIDSGGRIAKVSKALVEADVRKALRALASEVSEIRFIFIDPTVDEDGNSYPSFLSEKVLRVNIGFIPKGKAETIIANLGYTTK
jgi:hypothetical protein